MNIFETIFGRTRSSKAASKLTRRQFEAKKLRHAMLSASRLQIETPTTFLKQRHLTAVSGYQVSPVVARIPASLVRGQIEKQNPWWASEVVERSIDESLLTRDRRRGDTNDYLIKEEKRLVTLLTGETITTVRRVFYNTDRRKQFKELFVQAENGELLNYNSIPKHLMPLDGIDDVNIGGDRDLLVVEGYPAAESLRARGRDAVGIMSGTFDVPSERALDPILNSQTIYLWSDNDSAGATLMQSVARVLNRMGAREDQIMLIRWLGGPRKGDAFDFSGDDAELQKLIDDAVLWRPEMRYSTNSVLRLKASRGGSNLRLNHRIQAPRPEIGRAQSKVNADHVTAIEKSLNAIAAKSAAGENLTAEESALLRTLLDSSGGEQPDPIS